MKKFTMGFIVFVMFVFIASLAHASINPTTWITKDTPFLGEFVDDSPQDLYGIHCDIKGKMAPVLGTKKWEYRKLDNGKIAGYVDAKGFSGWCTNYSVAVKKALLERGYRWDQVKYALCSVYDEEKPDHVTVLVTVEDKEQWVMDSRQDFVMRPWEFPQKLTTAGVRTGDAPYIWWVQAEGKWIRVKI